MHPRIALFLQNRDKAIARRDAGIWRAMNAELRRFGIPDDATFANPEGPTAQAAREAMNAANAAAIAVAETPPEAFEDEGEIAPPPSKGGRPKLPRCEHDQIASRCPECNEYPA